MNRIKRERHKVLKEIVEHTSTNNQWELKELLCERGFDVTQATLSRDIKELRIVKSPDNEGKYVYTLSGKQQAIEIPEKKHLPEGVLSLEFSNNFGVIKTPPSYAGVIALDIDNLKDKAILGTIAGDDTILLIPGEGYSKADIIKALNRLPKK